MDLPSPADITVCVCTYRRSSIHETLASLAVQKMPEGWRPKVVVADNDVSDDARASIEDAARRLDLDLTYVHAPARNIARARNACLDACGGRWAAFIDDDEVASPEWLYHLVTVACRGNAGVVLGPVAAVYAADAPAWMKRADVHSTRPVWVRGNIETGYTCNAVIDLEDEALDGLRFDESFGTSGGEDSDFFARYVRDGGSIAYAEAAIVFEEVPTERTSVRWLLKRRFRMGQTHADIMTRPGDGATSPSRLFPMAVAKFALTGLCGLATFVRPQTAVPYLMRSALHLGVAARLLGAGRIVLYGGRDAA